jgi:hypothetical protein
MDHSELTATVIKAYEKDAPEIEKVSGKFRGEFVNQAKAEYAKLQ